MFTIYVLIISVLLSSTIAQATPSCTYSNNSISPCKNFTEPSIVNYACCDTEGGTVYNWTDNVNNTVIKNGYATGVTVDIGFDFQFFNAFPGSGILTSQVLICTNGILQFDTRRDCSRPPYIYEIPTTTGYNGFIAGFATDLNVNTINISTLSTKPYRMMVVQYDACSPPCLDNTWDLKMQVKLFETTNHIEIHYMTPYGGGRNVAIGVESIHGLIGLEYYIGTIQPSGRTNGYPKDETMIKFLPPPPINWNDNSIVSDSGSDLSIKNGFIVVIIVLFFIICLVLLLTAPAQKC